MLVELFGPTRKTCHHVERTSFAKARKSLLSETNLYLQYGMIREIFLSCRQMYCQGTAVTSILRSLVWQMFTRLTWEVLTELINFVLFILRVILPVSGIVTFFGFCLTYPFATRLFWSHFIALLMVRESEK